MKKTIITVLVTEVITLGIMGALLIGNGIITIAKVEENHNTQTYVDGQLVNNTDYADFMGYEVNIDVVDGTYIGR